MNFKKILQLCFLLLFYIVPINTLAYSNNVVVGGENIGINVDLKYVCIVGFYEVNGKMIAKDAGFLEDDLISSINGVDISSIDDMVREINESRNNKSVDISVIRDEKIVNIKLPLVISNDGIIKTGLYVKDKITGIGTLTYIDPESNIFGALGHGLLNKKYSSKMEIKNGQIFDSEVISVTPSENGNPGEKNARFYRNKTFGTINKNEDEGIFGKYSSNYSKDELMMVGNLDEVQLGKAYIRTVASGYEKKDYEINILEIYKDEDTKNILFEITDKELLNTTNGVVAGMSGSPIIQNNKIIAACTHVVVNNPHKGFAIGITNMLKEGEK